MVDRCRVYLGGGLLEEHEQKIGIEFLYIELPDGRNKGAPFGLVRYTIEGKKQKYGFRMDLQKQIFLDGLDDPEKQAMLEEAGPEIVRACSKTP